MNADQFLQEVNSRRPPHLPEADRELLQRYPLVLGSGPYYHFAVPGAIELLSVETQRRQQPQQRGPAEGMATDTEVLTTPPPTATQVVLIYAPSGQQRQIRQALTLSGLITHAGVVWVNFFPFTGRAANDMTEEDWGDADVLCEYGEFAVREDGEEHLLGMAIFPVLFIRGLPLITWVHSTYIVAGERYPRLEGQEKLPPALYQEFLNSDASSVDSIGAFIERYDIAFFGGAPDEEPMKRYWTEQQHDMRQVIAQAGRYPTARFRFPPHEDDLVDWAYVGSQFVPIPDPDGIAVLIPADRIPVAAEGERPLVSVQRYFSWMDYIWAELLESLRKGHAPLICERCGKLLEPSRYRGPPKHFCGPDDDLACYRARKADYARRSRVRWEP